MALLELKFRTENNTEEMVVKDHFSGLAVKEALKFLTMLENDELEADEALDKAVETLVKIYNNPTVTYDRIMNDLIFDTNKGFMASVVYQIQLVAVGKNQALKNLEAL